MRFMDYPASQTAEASNRNWLHISTMAKIQAQSTGHNSFYVNLIQYFCHSMQIFAGISACQQM